MPHVKIIIVGNYTVHPLDSPANPGGVEERKPSLAYQHDRGRVRSVHCHDPHDTVTVVRIDGSHIAVTTKGSRSRTYIEMYYRRDGFRVGVSAARSASSPSAPNPQ